MLCIQTATSQAGNKYAPQILKHYIKEQLERQATVSPVLQGIEHC